MSVINHDNIQELANRLHLQLHHFAKGTWPEADGSVAALPVNRFFMPTANGDGEYCYIDDGRTHLELRPGSAYFIPCYHKAAIKLSPGLQFLSIQFSLEFYEGIDLFSSLHMVLEFSGTAWPAKAEKAFQSHNFFSGALSLQEITSDFAAAVLNTMQKNDLDIVFHFTEFRTELDYIHEHCAATLTVDELSAVRGFRREVFSRKFTRTFGISPKQFLTRALVSRSCRLLLKNDCSVREVAARLKFSNEFYFSRFFKKHIGLPPHEFSRKHSWKTAQQPLE